MEHVVKFVNKNTVDVFWGLGWDNHCRFKLHAHYLEKVSGTSVPSHLMAELKERFCGSRK